MNSSAMSRMRVDDKDGCLWEPVALVDRPAPLGREASVVGRTGQTWDDIVLKEGLLLSNVWGCAEIDEGAGGRGHLVFASANNGTRTFSMSESSTTDVMPTT